MPKKKSKGVVLKPTPPYGFGGFEAAKARQKREALMQDYEELLKEADAMRTKLEAAKQKRLILAAEVRFLRRKYKHLVKTKNMNLSQESTLPVVKQVMDMTKQVFDGKEGSRRRLPPLPVSRPNKKRYTGKQVALFSTEILHGEKAGIEYGLGLSSDSNHSERLHIAKEAWSPIIAPILGVALRHSVSDLDLNRHNHSIGQEASLPNRALTFDLNEVSTGDEDFQNNVETMKLEAKKSLTRGVNEEQQNDLKFSICRNAGEGSARVGKRKISWQDPVALQV